MEARPLLPESIALRRQIRRLLSDTAELGAVLGGGVILSGELGLRERGRGAVKFAP
jgi:hypothetical protein